MNALVAIAAFGLVGGLLYLATNGGGLPSTGTSSPSLGSSPVPSTNGGGDPSEGGDGGGGDDDDVGEDLDEGPACYAASDFSPPGTNILNPSLIAAISAGACCVGGSGNTTTCSMPDGSKQSFTTYLPGGAF